MLITFSWLEDFIGTKAQAALGMGDNELTEHFNIAGIIAGDTDDFSEQSQSVYCNMDLLIRYLKSHSGVDGVLGQPRFCLRLVCLAWRVVFLVYFCP